MLVDNVGLGVKSSRTLGNGNALLVTAKRKSLKRIIEAGEEKTGLVERCLMDWQ